MWLGPWLLLAMASVIKYEDVMGGVYRPILFLRFWER